MCRTNSGSDLQESYLTGSQHEGLHDSPTLYSAPGGWYSAEVRGSEVCLLRFYNVDTSVSVAYLYDAEVIAHAVTAVSLKRRGRVEYVMQLQPLHVNPCQIHSSLGAIVNLDNKHWVALKVLSGTIWLLDSTQMPKPLSDGEYEAFVRKRRAAFPIVWADDMGAEETGTSAPSQEAATESPLLPLAQEEVWGDPMKVDRAAAVAVGASRASGETNVPSLMVAEAFGADEGMDIIQMNHMERGLELEALALEARSEYESALAERGGHQDH